MTQNPKPRSLPLFISPNRGCHPGRVNKDFFIFLSFFFNSMDRKMIRTLGKWESPHLMMNLSWWVHGALWVWRYRWPVLVVGSESKPEKEASSNEWPLYETLPVCVRAFIQQRLKSAPTPSERQVLWANKFPVGLHLFNLKFWPGSSVMNSPTDSYDVWGRGLSLPSLHKCQSPLLGKKGVVSPRSFLSSPLLDPQGLFCCFSTY